MAKGNIVNPADWLEPSDIALFEKVTGYTIKEGKIVDQDGNPPPDPGKGASPEGNLLFSLYHMRIYGTFDGNGQPGLITGEITKADLRAFISHGAANLTNDRRLLDKALSALG